MINTLPELNTEARVHSDHLRRLICQEIDAKGSMTLSRYMEITLYEPGLGYYRAGTQKFGAEGDFITAPELSPLFAACLARRCYGLLQQEYQHLFEIGAGSGILAVELMAALERLDCLPQQYYILELSSELQCRQQQLVRQRLPHLFERFVWLNAWPQLENVVVVANELFDAMPVHRFVVDDSGIKEYFITHHNGELQWHIDSPSTTQLIQQLQSYAIDFAPGYSSEINLMLPAWIKALCQSLRHAHMIFIDYGYKRETYYHPERSMGTLMCHFQHRAHDNPLLYPGVQDITTHVDFTLVAESAVAQGCDVLGLTTQAQFLLSQDITQLVMAESDPIKQVQLTQQLKQLLMPGAMGEAFKVLELVKSSF